MGHLGERDQRARWLADRELGDEPPALCSGDEAAVSLELGQREPQRRPADPDLFGEHPFAGQAGAGRIHSAVEQCSQPLVRLIPGLTYGHPVTIPVRASGLTGPTEG